MDQNKKRALGTLATPQSSSLTTYSGYGAQLDGNADGNPSINIDMSEHMAFEFGWAYDPYSNRFRAPGELLKQPPDEPKVATKCKIEISKPDAGWADLNIQFDDNEASVRCSHVYDPFIEMIKWLEMISRGQSSRIIINEEGCYTGISVYVTDESDVRIVVHRYWDELIVPIDCMVGRLVFIDLVYTEMLKFVSDKKILHEKWAWDWKEDGKEYPSLESELLDMCMRKLKL